MSINGYSYVHGNPVNWTDPSGELCFVPIIGQIACAAAIEAILAVGAAAAAVLGFTNYHVGQTLQNNSGAFSGIGSSAVGGYIGERFADSPYIGSRGSFGRSILAEWANGGCCTTAFVPERAPTAPDVDIPDNGGSRVTNPPGTRPEWQRPPTPTLTPNRNPLPPIPFGNPITTPQPGATPSPVTGTPTLGTPTASPTPSIVTSYRGLDGDVHSSKTYFRRAVLSPSQFRFDADGLSTFEISDLPGNKPYAMAFDISVTVPYKEGDSGPVLNVPSCEATYTPSLGGGLRHWSVNCNVADPRQHVSDFAKANPGVIVLNPNWVGSSSDRRLSG